MTKKLTTSRRWSPEYQALHITDGRFSIRVIYAIRNSDKHTAQPLKAHPCQQEINVSTLRHYPRDLHRQTQIFEADCSFL